MEGEQNNAFDHDIGFKMYSCFGNGYLLTGNKAYRHIIFRSAKTLTSRYSYKTGLIMSWEPDVKRDWLFPVIIDNMINLELLMEAYKMSGDTTLRHIAVSHADKTMKYHYRKNMLWTTNRKREPCASTIGTTVRTTRRTPPGLAANLGDSTALR